VSNGKGVYVYRFKREVDGMVTMTKNQDLKSIYFLRGLNDEEIAKISPLCREEIMDVGTLCQNEGVPVTRVNFIVKGKIGVEFHVPGFIQSNNDFILYTLDEGGVYGWSALIKDTPWSSMRVLETTTVWSISAQDLLDLCERDNHIGYVLMKNLSALVSSRLRRNRMATLNAIAAIR
jgi:CRP/FNR family transcriptional regulator, cyclic AMP receptor protein